MDRRLLICVFTIDGDVNYHYVTDDLVVLTSRSSMRVNREAVLAKFYPEYSLCDLLFDLVFCDVDDSEVI